MNKLQNINNTLTKSVKEKLKQNQLNVDVGDTIWDSSYGICVITKIDDRRIYVNAKYEDGKIRKHCFTFEELQSYSDRDKIIKLEKSWEEYEKEAIEYSTDTEAYILKQNELISTSDASSDSTDLIISCGKNDLIVMQDMFQRMTDKMKILEFILEQKRHDFVAMRNSFLKKLKHINRIIFDIRNLYGN